MKITYLFVQNLTVSKLLYLSGNIVTLTTILFKILKEVIGINNRKCLSLRKGFVKH